MLCTSILKQSKLRRVARLVHITREVVKLGYEDMAGECWLIV